MADIIGIARHNIELFNSGDFDGYREIQTPAAIYEESATQRRLNREDGVDAAKAWKAAFPDAIGTITNEFASGDQVTLEITWRGTQTGDLVGPAGTIPATGKPVELKAVQVVTIQGDKIAEVRHYFDLFGMLMQLGAIPAGAGAA